MRQKKILTLPEATIKIEALCARSERCSYEVYQKLRQWGLNEESANKIIRHLIDERFVDDKRFAKAFVNDKLRFSGYGKRKISLLLYLKKIDKEYINEAISLINDSEYEEILNRIISSKGSRMTDLDTYEGRTRLYRFGLSRGFESELISRAVKEFCGRLKEKK